MEESMRGETLVAVYATRAEAEQVRDRLRREIGIPDEDMRLSAEGGGAAASPTTPGAPPQPDNSIAPRAHGDPGGGLFDWLFGSDVPETDRAGYAASLSGGRTALAVYLRDGAHRERIADILEASDPLDLDQQAHGAAVMPQTGTASGAEPRTDSRASAPAGEGEQVIPVVKEELAVGKRPAERRHRIRTYVVERPVEEQVNLRDERVVVERRPVSGERAVDPGALQEREVEVVERHEEPVVAKAARAVEEVVLRKEAQERTERVRDTVRETKVEVDKQAAGGKPTTTAAGGGDTARAAPRKKGRRTKTGRQGTPDDTV
jgi:stress response protein YsnF